MMNRIFPKLLKVLGIGLLTIMQVNAQIMNLEDIAQSSNIPGYQWAYYKKDQLTHGEYGELKRGAQGKSNKVTEDSIFQVASLTKVVAAYIYLQLWQEGVYDLDRPLSEYLPNQRAEADPRYHKITARMVLQHRGGWVNWTTPGRDKAWTESPLVTQFEPGSAYLYSGEAVYYLQQVLEHLTGKSLEQLAQERVFKPFGMKNSSLVWSDSMERRAAFGHKAEGEPFSRSKFSKPNASYTMLSTACDYALFVKKGLLQGQGLKPETHKLFMLSRSKMDSANGRESNPHLSVAMMVRAMENEAGVSYYHTGANTGFRAIFTLYPETQEVLVLLTNGHNGRNCYLPALQQIFGSEQTFWMLR